MNSSLEICDKGEIIKEENFFSDLWERGHVKHGVEKLQIGSVGIRS